MKGNPNIITSLNQILCNEITAGNQFILHSRLLLDWGIEKLGNQEYDASIDEMKHADDIMKRILFLEGVPNVQKIDKINIGLTIEEILDLDLAHEYKAVKDLKAAIKLCEDEQDYVTRSLLLEILKSEEDHIDWLETQLSLLKKLGEQNYLQSMAGL